jgi:hypothetical protein
MYRRCVSPFLSGRAYLSAVVDRIIRNLELTFVAEKPPPSRIFEQLALMAGEESGECEWQRLGAGGELTSPDGFDMNEGGRSRTK